MTKQTAALQPKEVTDLFQVGLDRIREVVPPGVNAHRLVKLACSHIAINATTNPTLLKCTPDSLFLCLIESARLGLPLGGPLARAHPVPYYNSSKNYFEAKMIVDFKGYVELALRSGKVTKLEARIVHEKDMFRITHGDDESFVHEPFLDGDAGEKRGAYAIAKLANGERIWEWMPACDIEKVKKQAMGNKKNTDASPWTLHEDEMWRKTAVRRLQKYLPLTEMPELEMALKNDLKVEGWVDTPIIEDSRTPPPPAPPPSRAVGTKRAAKSKRSTPEPKPAPSSEKTDTGDAEEVAEDPSPESDEETEGVSNVPKNGATAFEEGLAPTANPFNEGTKEHDTWNDEYSSRADK